MRWSGRRGSQEGVGTPGTSVRFVVGLSTSLPDEVFVSCLLFYGPGAEEEALQRSDDIGRLLAEPFGAEGLKVADSREITSLMAAPPVGSGIGVVIIGPMDRATPEAQDALLKHLEEFDPTTIQPILWTIDLGAVFGTIRSRCLMEWCPHGAVPEMEHLDAATSLVRSAIDRDYASIIGGLKEYEGDNRAMLDAVAMVLADRVVEGKQVEESLTLWDSVREAMVGRVISNREILAALLLPPVIIKKAS